MRPVEPNFAHPSSPPPPHGRALLAALYQAAVAGVAPGALTAAALGALRHEPERRLWLFAVGKAGHAMAAGAVDALRHAPLTIAGGVIVTPEIGRPPASTIHALQGDHPLPGLRSCAAAERIAQVAARVGADDLSVVLVSGGTSSLIAAPLPGMSPDDVTQLFRLLMNAGLDIHAMNAVRKRFTRWGAGRLALALAPARTEVLVISDVPGDDAADVGSGPCAPDGDSARQVHAFLERASLFSQLPAAMRGYLQAAVRGDVAETPKPHDETFARVSTQVIGTNGLALNAAVAFARGLGMAAERDPTALAGEAAPCGEAIARTLLSRAQRGLSGCTVWGGETTVRLAATDGAMPPAGGRCQELALAAARTLAAGGETAGRVTILAAGTDGRDGPTDAAGAFADAALWRAISRAGHDPAAALAGHGSHGALHAAGALFRPGRTGTNVMDVVIGLVE